MIINELANAVPFENIGVGECFKHEKRYYMKILSVTSEKGTLVNAVMINEGYPSSFTDDTEVIPIKMEARVVE